VKLTLEFLLSHFTVFAIIIAAILIRILIFCFPTISFFIFIEFSENTLFPFLRFVSSFVPTFLSWCFRIIVKFQ